MLQPKAANPHTHTYSWNHQKAKEANHNFGPTAFAFVNVKITTLYKPRAHKNYLEEKLRRKAAAMMIMIMIMKKKKKQQSMRATLLLKKKNNVRMF